MKCITYSWVIFLLIIVISITKIVMKFLDNRTQKKFQTNRETMDIIIHTTGVVLIVWWIHSWFVECDKGYILSRGINII